jgi:WD40 repeat protein
MGMVYKARQINLNRIVALKVILAGQLASAEEVHRFHIEAEAAAHLDHPNIIPIYEVGEAEGQHYFTMKLVEGTSLAKALANGQWPAANQDTVSNGQWIVLNKQGQQRAARLLATISRAVHHAHQRGILHRDLKPANILLDSQGEPHITDFGLAKRVTGLGRDSRETLTQSGAIVGTPNYMAPEQARSAKVLTTAVDVYSLGAILYELVTGRPPFRASTPLDTILQVLDREPEKPRSLNPQVDRDLEIICLKCLQKEPERRYGSAAELADDLQRFLDKKPIAARPVGPVEQAWRWCRRNPVVALACALTLVALVAVSIVSTFFAFYADRAAQRESRAADNLREEQGKTEAALEDAKTERRQAEDRLVQMYVSNGVRLMDEGDLLGSLPWFVKALENEKGGPEREEIHRMRLGAVLQQCPKLVRLWVYDSPQEYAEFSSDGRRVITRSDDRMLRVWDAATGQPITAPLKHIGSFSYSAFSPDGRRLLTANSEMARVWDAASEQPVSPPLKHKGVVYAAFSPDGQRVFTVSGDQTARVWDAQSGQPVTAPLKHNGQVEYASFSPDGHWVVAISGDQVRVWDAQSGQPVSPPLKHKHLVLDAAFSSDGRWVVTASADTTARVWEAATGRPVTAPLKHSDIVRHASFSPDGRHVVTASRDWTARVWDAASGQPVTAPLKHEAVVQNAAFSPDGRRVVTAAEDRTVRVWDVESGRPVSGPLKHNGNVWHADFSPDGRWVTTASDDQTVRVWDVVTDSSVRLLHPPKDINGVFDAAFSPDGSRVVTASAFHTTVFDSQTGKLLSAPLKYNGSVSVRALSRDGRRVVTSGEFQRPNDARNETRMWDLQTGQALTRSTNVKDIVASLSPFSPDGRRLLVTDQEGMVRVWDAATDQFVTAPLKRDPVPVLYAAFSADGRRVVTVSSDQTAQIWDAESGRAVGSPLEHEGGVTHAVFSPDDGLVVTTSWDRTARVWDAQSGKPAGAAIKHDGGVLWAAFSPDGRRVVTASDDHTARVWDARSRQAVTLPLKHKGAVDQASFSPDGRCVLTSSRDHTARVWDAETGQPISPSLKGPVGRTIFAPDGHKFLMVGSDGSVRVWDLPSGNRPAEDWRLLAELLTGQRMDSSGGFTPLEPKSLAEIWQTLRDKYPADFAISPKD